MNEELERLVRNYFIVTPDNRLIGDKENRFNDYMFSYTGRSGKIYTSPRRIRWPSGKSDRRDIMTDRVDALGKKNKPIATIESFNYGYGYEFTFDHEVVVLNKHNKWVELLAKRGLTYSTISIFEDKYKKKNLKKGFFKNALDKRYHRLDLYDPIRHLNIEHDGEWCHIPELDEARDEFLLSEYPTIQIKRVVDYKDTTEDREKLKEIFDSYYTSLHEDPLVFRYDSWVVEQQLEENSDDLQLISEYLNKGYDLSKIGIMNELANKLNIFKKRNYEKPEILICA